MSGQVTCYAHFHTSELGLNLSLILSRFRSTPADASAFLFDQLSLTFEGPNYAKTRSICTSSNLYAVMTSPSELADPTWHIGCSSALVLLSSFLTTHIFPSPFPSIHTY